MTELCGEFGYPFHAGLVRSHDSFYTDEENETMKHWNTKGVLSSDMETAALFTVACVRGVKAASILNTVVEFCQDAKMGIADYVGEKKLIMQGEDNEILLALETLHRLDKQTT